MNIEVPVAFQLRVELQALSNALVRATSDRLKLLRLAQNALHTVEGCRLGDPSLATRLQGIRDALSLDLPVDRAEASATFRRMAGTVPLPARATPATAAR